MRSKFNKEFFISIAKSASSAILTLLKWLLCAVLAGVIIGIVGSAFHHMLEEATSFRESHQWILFLLPIAGLIIVFIYKKAGGTSSKGTNLVLSAIQSGERVPVRLTPLIIISTTLTHLFGGSAGREGAALQVGGSLANFFAKLLKFDAKDTKIMIMCGMSACFAALFGTPAAAAIFSMEVVSVGAMQYSAIVPCVLAALIANGISMLTGSHGTHFTVGEIPDLTLITGSKMLVMAVLFACASILLCVTLHNASKIYSKFIKNDYIKIIVAGLLIIALRYILGTTDYLGAGTAIINQSFVTSCAWYVFLLKILFTAVTLGGGFKGGEIVPTLFVGATLGSFLAPIFGLPIGLCAACGMVSVFCGVTNSPLTSLIIAIEMFGSESMTFCILCIAISYLLSGYYSLYHSQKFVFSKYKSEYMNENSL